MNNTTVCPYFDHNEDICDVGCGYISSHDASMIIKFCSCQHQDCQKYQELTSHSNHQEPVLPTMKHSMPTKTTDRPDNAPVLGLFCYGVTAACYAADKLPLLSFNLHLLAVIIIIGAIGQMYAGLNTLCKNPLRAIAFTGLGLFWLSILALDILPKAGYGMVTGATPMMGYLTMWGMFTLILSQGLEQQTRIFRVVLVLITAFLLILAMAHATGSTTFLLISALLGLASSLPGLYLGLRQINIETVQLFQPEVARSSKIRP
jgi:succinate-acetate transporter protein